MKNYSNEWKKSVNFRQTPYDEFVSIPFTNGTFMQKMDGMLGTLIYSNGSSFFQTTTGKEIIDIPALKEYETILSNQNIKEIKIPGELVAKKNGVILPFNESQSIVKRFKEEKNKDMIYHYPVDVIGSSFNAALSFIRKNFSNQKHISFPKVASGNLEVFRKLWQDTNKKPGFDGVVARDINGKNYKIKFIESVDLVVIGAGHYDMPSWPRKQVSYLLTSFIDKKGYFRTSSKVGSGFTSKQRSDLYEYIMKNKIYDQNGEVFIKPKLMIEVNYFRSRITKTPTLIYSVSKYITSKDELSVTFSNPSFSRIRNDKVPSKLDARLEQIPDFSY